MWFKSHHSLADLPFTDPGQALPGHTYAYALPQRAHIP